MSTRKVRKVRHHDTKTAPTFAELTAVKGKPEAYRALWESKGFSTEAWGQVDRRMALIRFMRLPAPVSKPEDFEPSGIDPDSVEIDEHAGHNH